MPTGIENRPRDRQHVKVMLREKNSGIQTDEQSLGIARPGKEVTFLSLSPGESLGIVASQALYNLCSGSPAQGVLCR